MKIKLIFSFIVIWALLSLFANVPLFKTLKVKKKTILGFIS